MTNEVVGIYWGIRQESKQACVGQLSAFMQTLASLDTTLSRWYKKVSSRKALLVPVPSNIEGLMQCLKDRTKDTGNEIISEIGFSFSAWTGQYDDTGISISVTCGAYSKYVTNCVVISFGAESSPSEMILMEMLDAMVRCFDPDDGIVVSDELRKAHPGVPMLELPAKYKYKRGSGFSGDWAE